MIIMEYLLLVVVIMLFFLLRTFKEKLGIWRWVFSFSFLCYMYIHYFFVSKTPNLYWILLLTLLFTGFFLYEVVRKPKQIRKRDNL